MSIQAFSFPVPETRFFQAGQQVFKFKIRRGDMSSVHEEEMLYGALVSEELENAVRAVLANLDGLHPFTTQHFNIFPYKSKWEQVSKMKFMKEGVKLSPYPFLITLYVEYREPAFPYAAVKNTNAWNTPEKQSILKSPLCASEPMMTDQSTAMDHPEEGTMNQHKDNKQTPECFQESPSSANGAEEMVCGSELALKVLAQIQQLDRTLGSSLEWPARCSPSLYSSVRVLQIKKSKPSFLDTYREERKSCLSFKLLQGFEKHLVRLCCWCILFV
uniref:Membrane anchored junction protein n=1 Tax=Cyprinus carpio TaxID=7962 RepID=A0A8C1K5P7_CYPCA